MHVRLGTVLLIGLLSLAMVVSAADLNHKYGVELRGGYGTIAMKDVNNQTDSLWGRGVTSATKLSGTPSFGVSILYRTDPRFLWEFGYNALPGGEWKAKQAGTGKESSLKISGSELFILPTYLLIANDNFTLGIGAGPDFAFVNANRSGDMVSMNFSNASGRTVGGMVKLNAELAMGKNNALSLSAGYRNHYVDRIHTEDDAGTRTYVGISTDATAQNLPIDMSGAFFQVGWRFYYSPSNWKAE